MSTNEVAGTKTSGTFVIGTPVSVGHVRPLTPLAKRLVERGFTVVWAISGDANEPASVWAEPLAKIGVRFVDVDQHAAFPRGASGEIMSGGLFAALYRRILARATDVSAGAADAIRAAVGDETIVGGIYDYFAVWAYVAMRRLAIADIDAMVSAFPAVLGRMPPGYLDDPYYQQEIATLRAAGFGSFDEVPRGGIIPNDPALRVINFSSPRLCSDAPAYVQVLGVQLDALPRVEDMASAPVEHQALARRLQTARAAGSPVLLLSMGTVVTRMFGRMGPAHAASLKRLYTTLAASGLRAGATIVASTCDSSAADLGVDEAALGPEVRDRVIAMRFVPQPFLFAHGLIDAMLMHGGANTFHEAIVSAVPLLISPGFGDQESVALAATRLGVGVAVESITYPALEGAVALDRIGEDVLPAMLAPSNRWKTAAMLLAADIKRENGLDAAEALIRAYR